MEASHLMRHGNCSSHIPEQPKVLRNVERTLKRESPSASGDSGAAGDTRCGGAGGRATSRSCGAPSPWAILDLHGRPRPLAWFSARSEDHTEPERVTRCRHCCACGRTQETRGIRPVFRAPDPTCWGDLRSSRPRLVLWLLLARILALVLFTRRWSLRRPPTPDRLRPQPLNLATRDRSMCDNHALKAASEGGRLSCEVCVVHSVRVSVRRSRKVLRAGVAPRGVGCEGL